VLARAPISAARAARQEACAILREIVVSEARPRPQSAGVAESDRLRRFREYQCCRRRTHHCDVEGAGVEQRSLLDAGLLADRAGPPGEARVDVAGEEDLLGNATLPALATRPKHRILRGNSPALGISPVERIVRERRGQNVPLSGGDRLDPGAGVSQQAGDFLWPAP
jgi:hypothetical protein